MHLTLIRAVALVATSAVGDSLGHRMFAQHPKSLPRPLAQVSPSREIVGCLGQQPKPPATENPDRHLDPDKATGYFLVCLLVSGFPAENAPAKVRPSISK